MRLPFAVKYPHRKGNYRTMDSAVRAAFAWMHGHLPKLRDGKITMKELYIVNCGVVLCRIVATPHEICVHFV